MLQEFYNQRDEYSSVGFRVASIPEPGSILNSATSGDWNVASTWSDASRNASSKYARARSGILSAKLFKEPAFVAALEESRWRNYPICLGHVALMVDAALRPHAPERAAALADDRHSHHRAL